MGAGLSGMSSSLHNLSGAYHNRPQHNYKVQQQHTATKNDLPSNAAMFNHPEIMSKGHQGAPKTSGPSEGKGIFSGIIK